MIPLARAGIDRGWDVVWACGADACPRIEQAGIRTVPAGLSKAERRKRRAAYLAGRQISPEEMADHTFPLFASVVAPAMLPDLVEFTDRWAPDLVVHEAAEFAGAIVAAARGAPSVTHGYGPLTPAHRVARAGEEAAPLWESMGLEAPPYGGSYEWLYLDVYPSSLQPTNATHVTRRQALRPMAFDATADEARVTWSWNHDSSRPFVYLSFGTTANHSKALRAVVEAIAPLDVELLVTVGADGDPSVLGDQHSNVQVERYVPQSQVFRQCHLVISHGGSGTFLGAASAAIAQLCLPQAADNFLNAQACARSGIGLALSPHEATGPAISDAVHQLLATPSFRARAQVVAAELADMPLPQEVLGVLEALPM